jgi:hypothetical protein
MGLFGKKKKKEPPVTDYRIVEKIEQSDLFDFLDEQRKSGKDVDIFYGQRLTPDDSWYYHNTQLTSLNSGIVHKGNFEEWGYSEPELNAIFGKFEKKMGLSHPTRCVKDLIWSYMFNQEGVRMMKESGEEKVAKQIQETMEIRRNSTEWLDWDRAIDEF